MRLVNTGAAVPTLPLENVVLITAFGKRSERIKSQALIEFEIGEELIEGAF
jgi:hypothetical protein